ncbi:hypothetical protein [Metapseudomonas otitidis]|uniref:hypothetical protein n=1 Tax=Metapseudomonas otitidis TaxID=319939 RepID=UPI0013F673A5|nr:hypothetical protein [Pseudomonas otitidis]
MRVDVESDAELLKAYDSFEQSIATAGRQGQDVLDRCINRSLWIAHHYNGRELLVETNGGRFLHVHCHAGKVVWQVLESRPVDLEPCLLDESTIVFRFPSGEEAAWHWREVLDSFRGRPFALAVSDALLFMFWRDGPEYLFNCYRSESDVYLVLGEC